MLVTVVTPCFNSETSVTRCFESVKEQGVDELEHIFVDDGSSDNTKALLNHIAGEYPHVKVFSQDNQGAAAARNLAIKMAQGRFICFLDSDDFWLKGKLASQLAFMIDNRVPFSYGDYFISSSARCPTKTLVSPAYLDYKDLLLGCPIGCLTACYDSHFFGKRYMPPVRRGQDWGLWLSLLREGGSACKYPGVHAVYSVESNSLSSKKFQKLRDIYSIYRDFESLGSLEAGYYSFRHAIKSLLK